MKTGLSGFCAACMAAVTSSEALDQTSIVLLYCSSCDMKPCSTNSWSLSTSSCAFSRMSYFACGTTMSLIETVVPDIVAKWKPRVLMRSRNFAVSALPYLR